MKNSLGSKKLQVYLKKKRLFLIGILIVLNSCQNLQEQQVENSEGSIIPKPTQMSLGKGQFTFKESTLFVVEQDSLLETSAILTAKFQKVAGWQMNTSLDVPSSNFVRLFIDTSITSEAYRLSVKEDAVHIRAADKNGFVYAMETLRLLLPIEFESENLVNNKSWSIPVIEIEDSPRYKWRGLMLDVSRHFFDVDYIKKTLDRMALLKLNTFHWHLVDDQGWRIEIKKYPKLTEIGAFRVDQEDKHWNARDINNKDEKATYGGFYTQNEIKEVVTYASKLGITVVPEIEMPAHVMSAIAAYPELSCFETPISVPSGGVWPITEIYCAGKESTFEFLEDVIDEVTALFPSTYIHVGGDEATKTNWSTCRHCAKRMQEENLNSVEELQSYFIRRMEKYVNTKGREIIGWDEIIEGGLAPGAAVMSWRGTEGGIEASEKGNKVVMTPAEFCYFDQYQGPQNFEPLAIGGYLPLQKVYEFDPVVSTMHTEQANLVLGGQANLWSEYIPTAPHSEYMLFPRLAALSETLWSTKAQRSWPDFSNRVKFLNKRLEAMGINIAKSAYAIRDSASINSTTKNISIKLHNEFEDSDIRYAIAEPADLDDYIRYEAPIQINSTTTISAMAMDGDLQISPIFKQHYDFHKAVGGKVQYNTMYNKSYAGEGTSTLVNVLRGSKNFHDGQWQAWLNKDIDLSIDLELIEDIESVSLGFLQNQGPDIYFPTEISIAISNDNKNFKAVGFLKVPYKRVNGDDIKDFQLKFEKTKARFVKIEANNGPYSGNEGGSWLFLDEIKIE